MSSTECNWDVPRQNLTAKDLCHLTFHSSCLASKPPLSHWVACTSFSHSDSSTSCPACLGPPPRPPPPSSVEGRSGHTRHSPRCETAAPGNTTRTPSCRRVR